MNDVTARRNDTLRIINEDPWDITVYRRKLPPASDETVTSGIVGRIQPTRNPMAGTVAPQRLSGEAPLGVQSWTLMVAYDAYAARPRDELKAVQRSNPTVTRMFMVTYCSRFAYKQEVMLSELQ